MPPKVDVDYSPGAAYHAQRAHLREHALHCLKLAFAIYEQPASLLDLGCGHGAHIGYCRQQKIDAIGVDLAVPADEAGRHLLHHDLRQPLDLGISVEWVTCWEVAEHLPKESAEMLCDTIARHVLRPSGRVFFTAATPGQPGPGHINCRPKSYWRGLFEARGLHYQESETTVLSRRWLADVPKATWYGKNLQVFAWA